MLSVAPAVARSPPGTAESVFDRRRFAEPVRALSRVNNSRGASAIVWQWTVIGLAAAAAIVVGHPAVYVAAMLVIATRQHALALIAHDATHGRLFTNRAVNDLVGNALLTFPLGLSISRYRQFHLRHHVFGYHDARDPEWRVMQSDPDLHWPKRPAGALTVVLKDLLALNVPGALRVIWLWTPWATLFVPGRAGLPWPERLLLLSFTTAVVAALWLTGGWLMFLLLWVLPYITFTIAIFRIRTLAEHLGVKEDHELRATRTVRPSIWERWLIAPCNANYHLEHHLFPWVPFYNLSQLHRLLMQDPAYAREAHITDTYFGVRRGVLGELLVRGT